MNILEVKATAFDSIVTAFYGDKLTKTYVDALITFVNQCQDKPKIMESKEPTPLTIEPVEDNKPAKAKKPTVRKSKKIDEGKLRTLREAEWPLDKIADELGVSVPTIRKHLTEMGMK